MSVQEKDRMSAPIQHLLVVLELSEVAFGGFWEGRDFKIQIECVDEANSSTTTLYKCHVKM